VVRFHALSRSTFTNPMCTNTQPHKKTTTNNQQKKNPFFFSYHPIFTFSLRSPQPHYFLPLFKRYILLYISLPCSLPNLIISTRLLHVQSAKRNMYGVCKCV
jgi:hypothetical protein